jgi:hypothetical protein
LRLCSPPELHPAYDVLVRPWLHPPIHLQTVAPRILSFRTPAGTREGLPRRSPTSSLGTLEASSCMHCFARGEVWWPLAVSRSFPENYQGIGVPCRLFVIVLVVATLCETSCERWLCEPCGEKRKAGRPFEQAATNLRLLGLRCITSSAYF